MANNANLDKVGCEYGRNLKEMLNAFKEEYSCKFLTCKEKISAMNDRIEDLERWKEMIDERILKFETKLAWLMGVSATIGSLIGTTIVLLVKHLL